MSKQVVFLGMHRSGTSMISGVSKCLGVSMGSRLLGKSKSNPLGHFEDIDFLYLNEAILKSLKSSWNRPPSRDSILNMDEKFIKKIELLIRKNDKLYALWGWKDPRTTLFIEIYQRFLSNPFFIICSRSQLDIAKSLNKRNGMPIQRGINLTNDYLKRIRHIETSDKIRKLKLNYDNALKNPVESIDNIISFLEINPSEQQRQEAIRMVHSRSDIMKLCESFKK